MEIAVGDHDKPNRRVSVTFTEGDKSITRDVNACYKANGHYDPDATRERVEDVARGVAEKFKVGVVPVVSEPEVLPAPTPDIPEQNTLPDGDAPAT